jgi:phosphoglycerate dehydrogenase-like enzyme
MTTTAKLKILIENESGLGPVFEIDPKRFAAACARHPDVAQRIEAKFSVDCSAYASEIADADVLIGWVFPHRALRTDAKRLRWVHLTGAGVNHLAPFDWVPEGVRVTNNRGVHAPKAAEFGALAALMLVQRIPLIASQQANRDWRLTYSPSIVGLTAGIVGVGNMGGAVAESCKRLGMRVLGIRRSGQAHPAVDEMFGPQGLDRLLAESDVLFLCSPLTKETRALIDATAIARMKPGAGLVNMARGAVVDSQAVIDALNSGRLSGAILDVFDPEPLPAASPIWNAPNLIVTPHCSSDDAVEYVPRTLDLIFDNVRALISNKPLRAQVNLDLEY